MTEIVKAEWRTTFAVCLMRSASRSFRRCTRSRKRDDSHQEALQRAVRCFRGALVAYLCSSGEASLLWRIFAVIVASACRAQRHAKGGCQEEQESRSSLLRDACEDAHQKFFLEIPESASYRVFWAVRIFIALTVFTSFFYC